MENENDKTKIEGGVEDAETVKIEEPNVEKNPKVSDEVILKGEKKKKSPIIIFLILIIIVVLACIYFFCFKDVDSKSNSSKEVQKINQYSAYRLSGNSLEDFDLFFLQLENEKKNKIYSPLSIKYALEMLEEGANGETKDQISNIIGTYSAKKYTNGSNMSFANALFIKDSFKDSIKESYINTLSNKYNANIVYDSFITPNVLNSWVSDKTFKLIDNLFDDISDKDYILVNALAIDMEWVKKIQAEHEDYHVVFRHEDYGKYISGLSSSYYTGLDFKDVSYKTRASEIGAVANKYDIISDIGEEKIREEITSKYQEWLNSEDYKWNSCNPGNDPDANTFVNQYIKELGTGYKHISSSTDFKFYNDDNVKVFAKDLKEYNGTTLQYVGIMPKNDSLDNYIKNIKSSDINELISNLKSIELDSFKDGVITEIYGHIPLFKFDYELNLMDDLNKLGIKNAFDSNKADLSNLSSGNAYISQATHKANIEFSNDGIKAAAATAVGGKGAGECGFDYNYKVPVEKIDLTFDNPYMFIIRDKVSGEVWFTGTVYAPDEKKDPEFN